MTGGVSALSEMTMGRPFAADDNRSKGVTTQHSMDYMARGGSATMDDQLDVPLEDYELLAEVELTTNLIIAASEAEAVLPQAQVDEILGLDQDLA